MTLTIGASVLTADTPALVALILDRIGSVVDEIVVGVDERITGQDFSPVLARSSSAFKMRIESPNHIHLAKWWLAEKLQTDWVLFVDTDEMPSRDMLRWLSSFDRSCPLTTSVGFSRRWVWPSTDRYLVNDPWRDDPQIRLVRMGQSITRCGRSLHEPLLVAGAQRIQPEPLYHLDLLMKSESVRREKVVRYQGTDGGSGEIDGLDFNTAFYVPEARLHSIQTADVPPPDRDELERAMQAHLTDSAATDENHLTLITPEHFRRDEAETLSCRVAVVAPPTRGAPGQPLRIPVLLENTGNKELLPHNGSSGIAIGYTLSIDGHPPIGEFRAQLQTPLRSGDSTLIYLHVPSPGAESTVVSFGVVDERVRWLTEMNDFELT